MTSKMYNLSQSAPKFKYGFSLVTKCEILIIQSGEVNMADKNLKFFFPSKID